MVEEGISQNLRNQKNDEIPYLYAFAQLLLAISSNDGRYGTTHTPAKFWSTWKDEEFDDPYVQGIKNQPLSASIKDALFQGKPPKVRAYFEQLWSKHVTPTEQDRLLVGLLDRHRFLEFLRLFILFDRKVGKIAARYPQAFGIKALLEHISGFKPNGERRGGVLWHTTGSGKSFTMVYLCRALLLSVALKNCRVIVVTDRVDLEKQLSKTFLTGGAFGSDKVMSGLYSPSLTNSLPPLSNQSAITPRKISLSLWMKATVARGVKTTSGCAKPYPMPRSLRLPARRY